MELYLKFFNFLLQCTSINRCALYPKSKMKNNFLFCVHTSFFIFYSFLHSPFSISLSSLSLHLFFLPPKTHRPFFLPQRPIADLYEPNRHKPVAADPRSATDLTHFGLSSLFLTFWFCVLGCAYVSALCFELCLCFGLACVSDLCFRHGFRCVVSTFG